MKHLRHIPSVVLVALITGSALTLSAEPIITVGLQRWQPDLNGLPGPVSGQGPNFEGIERRAAAQPHLGLRLPFCCAMVDVSYDYFFGESNLTGIELDLHDVGAGLGVTADPFKTILYASMGVDLLFLRQQGTFGGASNRTFTGTDWGWRLALGATYEPVPRWGIDLQWLRRGALRPQLDGLTYDLGGWQFSIGLSHFIR